MARIDATLATQVGDVQRPLQSVRDQAAQAEQAQRQAIDKPEAAAEAKPATPDEIKAAAARLQQVIEVASGRQLDFSFDNRFNELVAVIQDRKTGETISQIPSKDILKLRGQIDDLVGMVINRKI